MARKSGKNKGYTYRTNKNGTVTCRAYFDMPSGIRKQISATGRTKEESRKELNSKYAEIWKQGKQINSKGYTVEKWINYWLLNIKTNLKGNTRDSYYKSFNKHIIPLLGKIKLKDLTVMQIQKAVNKVKETEIINKNGVKAKIKGKSVKEIFAPLKQSLEYAMDENLMPDINLKRLDMPKVRKGTREIRSDDESKIITDYFANKNENEQFNLYYMPIAVMDARGIRPEECAGLRWEDIDYNKDIIYVGRHTVVKNGYYDENGVKLGDHIVVEDSTKTTQGEREMPLGSYLSCMFKAKYQEYLDKGIRPKQTDFIFLTKNNTLFYEGTLRKMYKSLAKKLGIKQLGCYSLRHEFATFLAQVEKCDRETIKQLMGWSNIIETYFHTDDKNKRVAISNIDKQFINDVNKNNIIQFPIKKIVNK